MDNEMMSDELIMAFADGELSAEEAKRVERLLEESAEARRKLEMFQKTAQSLEAARDDLPAVPEALAQRVKETIEAASRQSDKVNADNVVQMPLRNRSGFWPTAIAASIALAVGLGFGYSFNGGAGTGHTPMSPGVAVLAEAAIGNALSDMPSGTSRVLPSGATLNMIASFDGEGGVFCREFDYEAQDGLSLVSVACRVNDGWKPKIAIAVSGESAGQYAPASSLDALEAWLTSSGLGDPLDEDAEQKRLGVQLGVQ
eukprot:g1365.t1